MRLTTTQRGPDHEPCGPRLRGFRAIARQVAGEITPEVIEQIAHRVADLLTQRNQRPDSSGGMLTVNQLAIRLNVTRAWIYEHAQELGGIRLGDGPKARLRFDPDTATEALSKHQATSAPVPTMAKKPRPRQTSASPHGTDAPLLEIRGRQTRRVRPCFAAPRRLGVL